jgi:uncharacterized membrane protein
VVGLSLAAAAAMGFVSLYQVGLLRHLPDPPLPRFDADRVNGSAEAYPLGIPDALLGLGSYAVTATLAAAGGPDRARRAPWLPIALAAKSTADAAVAAKLTCDQAFKLRAFSVWSLLATAATFGILPLVMPEAWRAIQQLWSRRREPPALTRGHALGPKAVTQSLSAPADDSSPAAARPSWEKTS